MGQESHREDRGAAIDPSGLQQAISEGEVTVDSDMDPADQYDLCQAIATAMNDFEARGHDPAEVEKVVLGYVAGRVNVPEREE